MIGKLLRYWESFIIYLYIPIFLLHQVFLDLQINNDFRNVPFLVCAG